MSEPIIELRGVGRAFPAAGGPIYAVRDVTLSVAPGAFVVISGLSGSGKTSLLNLIGGLDRPTAGELRVAGHRLDRLGEPGLTALRRRVGFVFQSFALLPAASAYENVELGLRLSGALPRARWDGQVRHWLAAVGLGDRLRHRPNELSGGQQQRVAIARALAIEPAILLADEPTGDLDRATGDAVLGLLRELAGASGLTAVVATHDPAAAALATAAYQMVDGRLSPAEA